MTEPRPEEEVVVYDGMDGGAGLGAALQGSSPSSYMELASGFSLMKLLTPKPLEVDAP